METNWKRAALDVETRAVIFTVLRFQYWCRRPGRNRGHLCVPNPGRTPFSTNLTPAQVICAFPRQSVGCRLPSSRQRRNTSSDCAGFQVISTAPVVGSVVTPHSYAGTSSCVLRLGFVNKETNRAPVLSSACFWHRSARLPKTWRLRVYSCHALPHCEFINSSPIGFFPRKSRRAVEHRGCNSSRKRRGSRSPRAIDRQEGPIRN
jgi:hypothetical protein